LTYPIVRDGNGELITPNMLPAMGERWTPRRREIAALAVRSGLITVEQALRRWCMTPEELREWGFTRRRRKSTARAEMPIIIADFAGSLRIGEAHVTLNKTSYLIYRLLQQCKNKVVTPSMIGHLLYGDKMTVKPRIIDVFILRLRRQLQLSDAPVNIETVWGRGYLLRHQRRRPARGDYEMAAALIPCAEPPLAVPRDDKPRV
jgi:DNA-binding winged helix-turn-helix (wHTH) protein